jgi:hypothetical protein
VKYGISVQVALGIRTASTVILDDPDIIDGIDRARHNTAPGASCRTLKYFFLHSGSISPDHRVSRGTASATTVATHGTVRCAPLVPLAETVAPPVVKLSDKLQRSPKTIEVRHIVATCRN